MGYIEAETAIVFGRVVHGFRMRWREDLWAKTLVVPGFSDGHAHPQVVDPGAGVGARRWRDSYHWLSTRRLRVDEASLRADLRLSSRLAELTFARALLEGVTLIAVTGRLEANVEGWLRLGGAPRAVFLPTVMDRRGWPSVGEVAVAARRIRRLLADGLARVGVFVHSLGTARPESVRAAMSFAASERTVMGMHLSEGVAEAGRLREVLGPGPYPVRIAAVHCTESEDLPGGVYCVSCPLSNIILYGRTRKSLSGVLAFGSDWPLLLGTVPRHLSLPLSLSPGSLDSVLYRATMGGYRIYNMPFQGDFAAYDEGVERVLMGKARPRFVAVAGRMVVDEGRLAARGYSLAEVEAMIADAIAEAFEEHGLGDVKPRVAAREALSLTRRALLEAPAP
ncbi:MAG: hypothetical protein F7B17_00250 [Desulfurococcales archaeon]|nr:hypothetical protein [Desulfurococcales archaeon]